MGIALELKMYADEPCRICGKLLKEKDLNTAVFAGYSKDNKCRAAHFKCWQEYEAMKYRQKGE